VKKLFSSDCCIKLFMYIKRHVFSQKLDFCVGIIDIIIIKDENWGENIERTEMGGAIKFWPNINITPFNNKFLKMLFLSKRNFYL
jgi:hypothetical protein